MLTRTSSRPNVSHRMRDDRRGNHRAWRRRRRQSSRGGPAPRRRPPSAALRPSSRDRTARGRRRGGPARCATTRPMRLPPVMMATLSERFMGVPSFHACCSRFDVARRLPVSWAVRPSFAQPADDARLVVGPGGHAFPVLHAVRRALEAKQGRWHAGLPRARAPLPRPDPTGARSCRERAARAASRGARGRAASTRAAARRASSSSVVRPNRRASSDRGDASVTIGGNRRRRRRTRRRRDAASSAASCITICALADSPTRAMRAGSMFQLRAWARTKASAVRQIAQLRRMLAPAASGDSRSNTTRSRRAPAARTAA